MNPPSIAVSSILPRAVILAATVRVVLSASDAALRAVGAVKSIVILPPEESTSFNKPSGDELARTPTLLY